MKIRILLFASCCLLFGSPLLAQDEAGEEAASPESDVEAAAGEDSADASDAADEEEGPVGAAEARAADDLSIFVPSREPPPDDQAIFPVDI
jgi:hypothetical protein